MRCAVLCSTLPQLCDHTASLGYVERLLDPEGLKMGHGRKAMLR